MKVRSAGSFHTLEEAMQTCVEVKSRASLIQYLKKQYPYWHPTDANVTIEPYGQGIDERIGWHTHLICVNGNAALFSDSSFEE